MQKDKQFNKSTQSEPSSDTKPDAKEGVTYRKQLLKTLVLIEDLYGLGVKAKSAVGRPTILRNLDIVQINQHYTKQYKVMLSSQKRARTLKVTSHMSAITYLAELAYFRRFSRIDFKNAPGIIDLSYVLQKYTTFEESKVLEKRELNTFLTVLQNCEATSRMRKNKDVAYVMLRLCYLFILFDDLFDAAILARFLLHQMQFSNGGEFNDRRNYGFSRRDYERNQLYSSGYSRDSIYPRRQQGTMGFDKHYTEGRY